MAATRLRSRSRNSPAGVTGARTAEFPGFIEPCDPSLRQHAPAGDDCLYEIKADGYRAQVHVRDGNVVVYSRTGLNWTEQFRDFVEAVERLKLRQAIFDGEAVAYGAEAARRPSLPRLRSAAFGRLRSARGGVRRAQKAPCAGAGRRGGEIDLRR